MTHPGGVLRGMMPAVVAAGCLAVCALALLASAHAAAQEPAGIQSRTWHVVAKKYSYSEPRIEVEQDDLVKITFETADIPHSFTIDEPYRIAKRATRGHPVVFEFRADKPGTFTFYCSLKADDGCRNMKGTLVVRPKK